MDKVLPPLPAQGRLVRRNYTSLRAGARSWLSTGPCPTRQLGRYYRRRGYRRPPPRSYCVQEPSSKNPGDPRDQGPMLPVPDWQRCILTSGSRTKPKPAEGRFWTNVKEELAPESRWQASWTPWPACCGGSFVAVRGSGSQRCLCVYRQLSRPAEWIREAGTRLWLGSREYLPADPANPLGEEGSDGTSSEDES